MTHLEKVQFKRFLLMCRERGGEVWITDNVVFLVGIGLGGDCLRCLFIVIISMGPVNTRSWGRGSKVITWRGGQAKKVGPGFMGGVDPSRHYEGYFHFAILLFWNSIVSLFGYCKSLYKIALYTILLLFYLSLWEQLVASKCIHHLCLFFNTVRS